MLAHTRSAKNEESANRSPQTSSQRPLEFASTAVVFSDSPCLATDLICFSHLRWDFVYQRPQHLLSRFAKHRRVFYVEEPVYSDGLNQPLMKLSTRDDKLVIATPHLPRGYSRHHQTQLQQILLDEMIAESEISDYTLWYYTPMALSFSRHLRPKRTVFDAMDELSAFKNAPKDLCDLETELMARCDHIFTGGHSIYEKKRHRHFSVHAFPSSVDYIHFSAARKTGEDPLDQADLPHPRVGYFGVVDERFDCQLLDDCASLRPDWQFVVIGPTAKIQKSDLPRRPNIRYLGLKKYEQLPSYLSHWDLAILPFALNEATEFISPTKTPEYLAAGKPVVSTPIQDVVQPYGDQGLVHIAKTPVAFCEAGEKAMLEKSTDANWFEKVDHFLAGNSWDQTWQNMALLEKEIDCLSASRNSEVPTSSLH